MFLTDLICWQVKLSRFFEWAGKWKNLSPYWTFLKEVYTTLRLTRAGRDAEPDDATTQPPEPAEAHDDQAQPGGRKQSEHLQLIKDFKAMQKTRHTLDVVHDILNDDKIVIYAWMTLRLQCSTCVVLSCKVLYLVSRSEVRLALTSGSGTNSRP